MLTPAALIAALLSSVPATPADSTPARSLAAVRLPNGQRAPEIDGKLSEAVWATAPAATDFVQMRPNPGKPASERTEVRILYDDASVYVAARMYDSRPDSVVGQLARRDADTYSDGVFVAFDSRRDRRTAYAFGINPRGVKQDAFIYNDGQDDSGWDAVWDGAAQTDSLGWTAEFRIPLSQLRFRPGSGPQEWGFNVQREIARRGEEVFWAPILPSDPGIVSRFGTLTGLAELRNPGRLELQPYSVARLTRAPGDGSDPFYRRNDPHATVGADLKYGITPNLTLTATLNPDFGQVEADPSQVNLSAYETFLRERRPFFVEGVDIFRFGLGAGDGDNESLFYSRRIGRRPQGSVADETAFEDAPTATRILGAAKLSGKVAGAWSIGLLNAVTAEEHARFLRPDGSRGEATVEPLSNYTIGRVVRDFRGGTSAMGAIVTSTLRDLPEDGTLDGLRSRAFTAGADARHRFAGGKYEVRGWLLGSRVEGDTLAILRTQRSPARYFQRPDAEHLRELYDPSRTSLSGWSALTEFVKVGGGNWRYGGFLSARSPGFEVNDVGYLRETDYWVQAAFASYRQPKAGKHLRSWGVGGSQHLAYTFGHELGSLGANVNGNFQLLNFWGGYAGIRRNQQSWETGALRGGPAIQEPGSWGGWFGGHTDNRKRVVYEANGGWSAEDDGDGYSLDFSPEISARPSSRSSVSVGPSFGWRRGAWQYVATRRTAGRSRYLFSDLDQTTLGITARVNYTFTPNLSLQLYAQPFVAAGEYTDFKEVTDPRARRMDERFRPLSASEREALNVGNPDFNYKAFNSNAVLRWEYRPGSTLFVVWSQGREDVGRYGDFQAGRDLGRLFGRDRDYNRVEPTNVLLIKASYWLGR